MNWQGPTFTDSGGFQVLSLGSGFKKVLAMETDAAAEQDVIAPVKQRRAIVDDEGVTFTSHIDGSKHRFTPEHSIEVQHAIGADIIFAFDELTSLLDPYEYQAESLARTHAWADRCLSRLDQLRTEQPGRPYQALFGVLQGAQYEDLRKMTAWYLGERDFDGYGIGGALEKSQMGTIIRWVNEVLPAGKPKHLLGSVNPMTSLPRLKMELIRSIAFRRHGSAATVVRIRTMDVSMSHRRNTARIWVRFWMTADVTPVRITQGRISTICSGLTSGCPRHLCRSITNIS